MRNPYERRTARQNAALYADASQSGATPAHTANWPPDGTAARQAAPAGDRSSAVPYNDPGSRLKNLIEAVALREIDLAQAQCAPTDAEDNVRLGQIAGRLHRARTELVELQSSR
jgi:hypothetical protein